MESGCFQTLHPPKCFQTFQTELSFHETYGHLGLSVLLHHYSKATCVCVDRTSGAALHTSWTGFSHSSTLDILAAAVTA